MKNWIILSSIGIIFEPSSNFITVVVIQVRERTRMVMGKHCKLISCSFHFSISEFYMLNIRRFFLTFVAMLPIAFGTSFAKAQDIVDTAIAAGQFGTLVAAVQAADLVDTLKSEGPFTVFAPTDEAFAALPEGTVENLLKPENKDQLIAVLTYHVVPGAVMSGDIAGKKLEVATVQGSELSIDATMGVKVDNATVVSADIETSNGVIHVIDQVLLPN
jgi:hypothetical protein